MKQQDIDAGLSRTQVGQRRVASYDPLLALEIIEKIAEGQTLSEICAAPRLPSRTTFLKWVARVPELQKAYYTAREISALALEEEALNDARSARDNVSGLSQQQLRALEMAINQFRWSAARRDPKTYGEANKGQVTVPIHIHTSLDMGTGQKASQIEDVYTIEAQAEVPAPEALAAIDAPLLDVTATKEIGKPGKGRPGQPRKQVLQPRQPFAKALAEAT